MGRQAKIDANGVLLEHGFVDYGQAGVPVADNFALQPGAWRTADGGNTWQAFTPPPPPPPEAQLAIDAALADPNVQPTLKRVLAALRPKG